MSQQITRGVQVSVETYYQEKHSHPAKGEYVFAYRISIENHSEFTLQLISRHWNIFDASKGQYEVQGKGVVGKQPVLKPGAVHQYVSGCQLHAEMGKMLGSYTMKKMEDGTYFNVDIPEFKLIVPHKMNWSSSFSPEI